MSGIQDIMARVAAETSPPPPQDELAVETTQKDEPTYEDVTPGGDVETEVDADDVDVDADADAESAPAPETYAVTVRGPDGEEVEENVTLEELQKGYTRQADYTRKTQEAAKTKREALAEKAALDGEKQSIHDWFSKLGSDPEALIPELERVLGGGVVRAAVDRRIVELCAENELPEDQRNAREMDRQRAALQRDREAFQEQQQRQQATQAQQYWAAKFQEWGPPAFEGSKLPETTANWNRVYASLKPHMQSGQPLTQTQFEDAVKEAALEWTQEHAGHLATLEDPDALEAALGEERIAKVLAARAKREQAKANAKAKAAGRKTANGSGKRKPRPDRSDRVTAADLQARALARLK